LAQKLSALPSAAADWLFTRRDRLLGSPGFHRAVLRFPPTRWIARRRARQLFDITAGFVYSQVLAACVQLQLFDRLAAGPRGAAELARECDIPEEAFGRLLEAAAELQLLQRSGANDWRLGSLGAASLGSPGIAAMVNHHGVLYRDLADPLAILRDRSHSGLRDYWCYAGEQGRSEADAAVRYSELMARSQSFVADDVLAQYPLYGHRLLADVGGGSGVFASEALRRFPDLRAAVFDLPDVAALATERFAVEGMQGRAQGLAGNMFADPLPVAADVVSLIRILHDHDDEAVMHLLRLLREHMRSDGVLLVAEPMAQTRAAPGVGAYFHFYLWAMGSGRPRSRERLKALLEAAGFADVRERRSYQPLLVRVLTARPAAIDSAS
jgi:demethylspheroidene O-methyltransferase